MTKHIETSSFISTANQYTGFYMIDISIMKELTQLAWMHLRCMSDTSHAASQRHLKEVRFANLGDVSGEMY